MIRSVCVLLLLAGLSTPLAAQQDTVSVDTVAVVRNVWRFAVAVDSFTVPDTSWTVTVVLGCAACASPVDTISDSAKAVMPQHITITSQALAQVSDSTYTNTVAWTPDQWVDSVYVRPNDAGVVPFLEEWQYAGDSPVNPY